MCVCDIYTYLHLHIYIYMYIIYPILYQHSIKNVDVSFHSCQPNDSTGRPSVGPVGPLEMEPLRYHRRGHTGRWPWRKHLGDLWRPGRVMAGRPKVDVPVGFLWFSRGFWLFLLEFCKKKNCWMMFGIWWCVLMTMLVGVFLIWFYIISIIMKVWCMIIMLIGSLRSLMFVLFLGVSMGNRL